MKIIRFISISILITLISCQSRIYDFERSVLMINNQQIEILTAYEIFDNFITTNSNYTKEVFKPIEHEFNSDAEYLFMLETLKNEIKPSEDLKRGLAILKEIDWINIVDSAFQILTKELPGPDTKILIIPANPENREMYEKYGIGMHAFTVGTGRIIISIDPTFNNWRQLLPYTLAHEYHHSVWTSRNFISSDFTPLEYLVLEGRADSFAKELFSFDNHPFINMLTGSQEKRIWDSIKPELNKRNSEMNDKMMYGTEDIPYGSVYSIGFNIIESFKKNNSQISDKELLDMTPEQIMLVSKYDEHK